MNDSPNKKLVQQFIDLAWNKRDVSALGELMHDDITYMAPRVNLQGKDNYLQLIEGYMSVFTESQFRIIDLVEEKDKVLLYAEFTGVHSGPYGDIPATNKKVSFQLMSIVRIRDGKIVSEHELFDEYGFLLGLGMEMVQKASTI